MSGETKDLQHIQYLSWKGRGIQARGRAGRACHQRPGWRWAEGLVWPRVGRARRWRQAAGLQTRSCAMGGAVGCEASPCEGGDGRQTPLYILRIRGLSRLRCGYCPEIAQGGLEGSAPSRKKGVCLGGQQPPRYRGRCNRTQQKTTSERSQTQK